MISKVRDWLEAQGFSLEMRTASRFRSAGFEVRQSEYYTDAETGKVREIDVTATDPDFIGIVNIRFVVECKSSSKPWVLLSSNDTLVGYNRLFAFAAMSDEARSSLSARMSSEGSIPKFPWFHKEGKVGYALRQPFSDNDVAYAAAIAVSNACSVFVHRDGGGYFAFAFPIIVVDSPLMSCSLGDDGNIQVEEVREGEFLFAGHKLGTCVRVVTASHLSAFTAEAKAVADQLRAALKSEEDRVIASWRAKSG